MPPFHILQAEVEFFQEGEGMVALFGVAEAFVARVVFAVYVLYCGVPLRHKAGEEGVYGFVGGFYGACGFSMCMKSVSPFMSATVNAQTWPSTSSSAPWR